MARTENSYSGNRPDLAPSSILLVGDTNGVEKGQRGPLRPIAEFRRSSPGFPFWLLQRTLFWGPKTPANGTFPISHLSPFDSAPDSL